MKMHHLGWTRVTLSLVAGVWGLGAGLAAGAEDESNLQKSFTVNAGGKLVVDADRGSIDVKPGAGDKVDIQVFRKVRRASAGRAEEIFANHEVTFQQDGNEITVKARYKKDLQRWRLWSPQFEVRYQITVPGKFNLALKTAGGGIGVSDLAGDLRAETAGGSIKVSSLEGPAWCRTAGGSIHVAGCGGPADLETAGGGIDVVGAKASVRAETAGGSIKIGGAGDKIVAKTSGGGITVDQAGGSVDAETAGGSISIKLAKGEVRAQTSGGGIQIGEAHGKVDASTAAGAIAATLVGQPKEDCRLETSGGDIRLSLSEDIAVNIDAKTSGGRVSTELPVVVQGEQKGHALVGKLGNGGSLLRLRTAGGSIYLKKR